MNVTSFVLSMLVALSCFVSRAVGLQIWDYDPARHNVPAPGVTNPLFVGFGYTGWNAISSKSTVVAPSYVIGSNHFADSGTLTFDTGSGLITRNVVSAAQVGTSDLRLSRLDSPLPPSITPLAVVIVPEPADPIDRFDYVNTREVFLYGQGRVGKNIGTYISFFPTVNTTIFFPYNDPASGGFDPDEAWTMTGDSGGPTLLPVGSGLALLSIHYANAGTGVPNSSFSIDSLLSQYVGTINSMMVGEQLTTYTLTLAPEPILPIHLALFASFLLVRRRIPPRMRPFSSLFINIFPSSDIYS